MIDLSPDNRPFQVSVRSCRFSRARAAKKGNKLVHGPIFITMKHVPALLKPFTKSHTSSPTALHITRLAGLMPVIVCVSAMKRQGLYPVTVKVSDSGSTLSAGYLQQGGVRTPPVTETDENPGFIKMRFRHNTVSALWHTRIFITRRY